MRQIAPRTGAPEVTMGAHQLEYSEITVAQYRCDDGVIPLVSRWRLTAEERAAIANGDDLYVVLLTNGVMQPILPMVGPAPWMLVKETA